MQTCIMGLLLVKKYCFLHITTICQIFFVSLDKELEKLNISSPCTITGGIVSNTLRPPIPEYCDPEWRSLMERCWSADPSERPNFTEIASQLRTMAAKVPPKVQAQQQPPSTQPQAKN